MSTAFLNVHTSTDFTFIKGTSKTYLHATTNLLTLFFLTAKPVLLWYKLTILPTVINLTKWEHFQIDFTLYKLAKINLLTDYFS